MAKGNQQDLSEMKRKIDKLPKGVSRRYPTTLLLQIGEHAQKQKSQGRSLSSICDELSITSGTVDRALSLFEKRDRPSDISDDGFVQVVPCEDSNPTAARIVLRSGAIIEGLSFEELVRFSKAS